MVYQTPTKARYELKMQKMWQLLSDYRRNIFHGCFYLEEKEDTGDDHPSCLQLPSTSILP